MTTVTTCLIMIIVSIGVCIWEVFDVKMFANFFVWLLWRILSLSCDVIGLGHGLEGGGSLPAPEKFSN